MLNTVSPLFLRGRWLAIALLVMLGIARSPSMAALPDAIARIKQSLVVVGSYRKTRVPAFMAVGTGFVVGDGRVVATNAHVANSVLVANGRGEMVVAYRKGPHRVELRRAHKMAVDRRHDVALLKLLGMPLAPLRLGVRHGEAVREGDRIAFSGFPVFDIFGAFPATSGGIIAAIAPIAIPAEDDRKLTDRQIRTLRRGSFDIYQLDATAYPGNSGSPLYEASDGDIIGIVNMVLVNGTKESAISKPTGVAYAVPIRYVKDLLEQYTGR